MASSSAENRSATPSVPRKRPRRPVTGSLFWRTLDIPQAECAEILRRMHRIRKFEEKVLQLAGEKLLPPLPSCSPGHEAIAAGACSVLRREDFLAATQRQHAYAIARDGDLTRLLAELAGRDTGCCRGRGGAEFALFAQSGNVAGSTLAMALGAAQGCKLNGEKQIVLCAFAPEAADGSAFDDALKTAGQWQLPLVFLCESPKRPAHSEHVFARAEAAGLDSATCDGMNVLEVRESVAAACERARKGVPSLIEALVYRCPTLGFLPLKKGETQRGSSERNQTKHQAEFDAWKAKDPIRLFRTRLNEAEVLSTGLSAKIEQEVTREVEAAAKAALKP